MELKVLNIKGKETKKSIKLDASVFGVEPNDHVIYLDVKQYLANARQGTHKTKERGEVNRTTKKHHKQKRYWRRTCGFIEISYSKRGWYCFRSTSSYLRL